jgi:hypothetical protein
MDGWILSGWETFVSHWVLVIHNLHHFTKNRLSRGEGWDGVNEHPPRYPSPSWVRPPLGDQIKPKKC